jgi:hypothetical protein
MRLCPCGRVTSAPCALSSSPNSSDDHTLDVHLRLQVVATSYGTSPVQATALISRITGASPSTGPHPASLMPGGSKSRMPIPSFPAFAEATTPRTQQWSDLGDSPISFLWINFAMFGAEWRSGPRIRGRATPGIKLQPRWPAPARYEWHSRRCSANPSPPGRSR